MVELLESWVLHGKQMTAEGDASEIDRLLGGDLLRIAFDWTGWRQLYRHTGTGRLWELDFPQGEMHGGGPRRLRELDISEAEEWDHEAGRDEGPY